MQPRPMRRTARLARVAAAALALPLVLAPVSTRAAEWPEAVPPEPGTVVLPDALTLQAMVGDVDGDGRRELLRLIRDAATATLLEVWRHDADGWSMAGEAVEVLAGNTPGRERNAVYAGAPARLLPWDDGGGERVMIVTQPRFEELAVEPACCMVLRDVRLVEGAVRLLDLGGRTVSVDAVLALDLDGDGRDELLASRSLPPLADSTFPLEAQVLRFDGERFGRPETTELPFGSGDSPFLLGETDGVPGEEAGVIDRLAPPTLLRLRLDDDAVVMELSPLALGATEAAAVQLEDGPGVAVVQSGRLSVLRWPAGEDGEVIAVSHATGELVGVADMAAGRRFVVGRDEPPRATVLGADLLPVVSGAGTIVPTGASLALAARRLTPYAGPVPGGGVDGRLAVVYGGHIVGGGFEGGDGPYQIGIPSASFPASVPVGLAGDGSWMAVLHADLLLANPDRDGGPLASLDPLPGARLSIAPLEHVLRPEEGRVGAIAPPAEGIVVAGDRELADPSGLRVEIEAPPGSEVLTLGIASSVPGQQGPAVVPESGRTTLTILPPPPDDRTFRPTVVVLTPAGHAYHASWDLEVLHGPPEVRVEATTPFASTRVEITGRVARPAIVTIDGAAVAVADDGSFRAAVPAPPWPSDVLVTAVDPVGNRATSTVSVVGILDYRRLPWVPIVALLTAAAAVVLFVRAPRLRAAPARSEGDATLEELGGDEPTG